MGLFVTVCVCALQILGSDQWFVHSRDCLRGTSRLPVVDMLIFHPFQAAGGWNIHGQSIGYTTANKCKKGSFPGTARRNHANLIIILLAKSQAAYIYMVI